MFLLKSRHYKWKAGNAVAIILLKDETESSINKLKVGIPGGKVTGVRG